jgi:hypothetical protein
MVALETNNVHYSLFNNLKLSDVTIKQIYNGETREYYAHKAVLCMTSECFLGMFMGDFKVIESAATDVLELFKAATDPSLLEGIIVTYYAPGLPLFPVAGVLRLEQEYSSNASGTRCHALIPLGRACRRVPARSACLP